MDAAEIIETAIAQHKGREIEIIIRVKAEPKTLSITEAARHYKRCRNYFENLIEKNAVPFFGHRKYRFYKTDLDQYMEREAAATMRMSESQLNNKVANFSLRD